MDIKARAIFENPFYIVAAPTVYGLLAYNRVNLFFVLFIMLIVATIAYTSMSEENVGPDIPMKYVMREVLLFGIGMATGTAMRK